MDRKVIPHEWVEEYLRKSGDDKIASGNIEISDHGFCVWGILEDKLILIQVYGDGEFWDMWADNKAEEMGKEKVFFATKRSPRSFAKKYGYEISGYILERKAKWVA